MTVDWNAAFRAVGLDRYDVMARLRPALFTLLPVFLVIGVQVPDVHSSVGAIVSAATACGVTYFLVLLARWRGRVLEQHLGERAGRLHSARLLTFSDTTFARESKLRYRIFLKSKGIKLSAPEEESADPAMAFDRARSAVDWLLIYTRPRAKETLLFDDNIAYGFTRNLCGLKQIAICICLIMMTANGALIYRGWSDHQDIIGSAMLEAALLVMLILWIFLVTESAVSQASLAYAQRLFAHCETSSPEVAKSRRASRSEDRLPNTGP